MADNISPLVGGNFTFTLHKLNNTTLNLQSVTLPTLSIGEKLITTPVLDYSIAGDKLQFDRLNMSFIVNDDMSNYDEVFEWLYRMSNPITGKQVKNIKDYTTDGVLSIFNTKGKKVKEYRFTDCFPVFLGGLQLNTTNTESSHLTCDLGLSFTLFHDDHKDMTTI